MRTMTLSAAAAVLLTFGGATSVLAQSTTAPAQPMQQYQAGGGSAGKDQVQQYQAGGGSASGSATSQYKKGAAQSLAPSSATPYQTNGSGK